MVNSYEDEGTDAAREVAGHGSLRVLSHHASNGVSPPSSKNDNVFTADGSLASSSINNNTQLMHQVLQRLSSIQEQVTVMQLTNTTTEVYPGIGISATCLEPNNFPDESFIMHLNRIAAEKAAKEDFTRWDGTLRGQNDNPSSHEDAKNNRGGKDIEKGNGDTPITSEKTPNPGILRAKETHVRFQSVIDTHANNDDDDFIENGTARGTETSHSTMRATTDESLLKSYCRNSFTQQNRFSRTAQKMIRMRDIWTFQQLMSYSTWTIYALVIMHVFGLWGWAFPDGNDPTCSSGEVAIKATATVYVTNNATATAAINDVMANVEKHAMAYTNKNTTFCGLVQLLSTASSSLSTLAAFIIGGFIYSTRVLWLARRTAYCNLCGAIKKLLMNVATIIPERDRKVLSRWAILGFELSVLEGRMLIDTDEARHFLETSGLIIEDEWESMVNGNRHTTVWLWIQTKAKRLKDQGQISECDLAVIFDDVAHSRATADDMMSRIDRDQPPPYIFVCAVLININLFFYASAHGAEWATWTNEAGGMIVWTEPRLHLSIIITLLYTTIFAMLFDICAVLYNPFGPRAIDVPHRAVGKGMRNLAKSFSKSDGKSSCYPQTMSSGQHIVASFTDIAEDTDMALEDLESRLSIGTQEKFLMPGLLRKRWNGGSWRGSL